MNTSRGTARHLRRHGPKQKVFASCAGCARMGPIYESNAQCGECRQGPPKFNFSVLYWM